MEEILERRRRERARVIREATQWAQSLPPPHTVVLVGSYARGDFNQWSDVDLILVSPRYQGMWPLDRLKAIEAPPGYEPIPLTPAELQRHLDRGNPLAVEAACTGVVLRDDLGLTRTLAMASRRLCSSPG